MNLWRMHVSNDFSVVLFLRLTWLLFVRSFCPIEVGRRTLDSLLGTDCIGVGVERKTLKTGDLLLW